MAVVYIVLALVNLFLCGTAIETTINGVEDMTKGGLAGALFIILVAAFSSVALFRASWREFDEW